ncbi:unnamed protein product [Amoebophrya sp. A25]|nr:unnamed protein product [Amoebophrya sp. A25]|eukprot:GSA25T00009050001.1
MFSRLFKRGSSSASGTSIADVPNNENEVVATSEGTGHVPANAEAGTKKGASSSKKRSGKKKEAASPERGGDVEKKEKRDENGEKDAPAPDLQDEENSSPGSEESRDDHDEFDENAELAVLDPEELARRQIEAKIREATPEEPTRSTRLQNKIFDDSNRFVEFEVGDKIRFFKAFKHNEKTQAREDLPKFHRLQSKVAMGKYIGGEVVDVDELTVRISLGDGGNERWIPRNSVLLLPKAVKIPDIMASAYRGQAHQGEEEFVPPPPPVEMTPPEEKKLPAAKGPRLGILTGDMALHDSYKGSMNQKMLPGDEESEITEPNMRMSLSITVPVYPTVDGNMDETLRQVQAARRKTRQILEEEERIRNSRWLKAKRRAKYLKNFILPEKPPPLPPPPKVVFLEDLAKEEKHKCWIKVATHWYRDPEEIAAAQRLKESLEQRARERTGDEVPAAIEDHRARGGTGEVPAAIEDGPAPERAGPAGGEGGVGEANRGIPRGDDVAEAMQKVEDEQGPQGAEGQAQPTTEETGDEAVKQEDAAEKSQTGDVPDAEKGDKTANDAEDHRSPKDEAEGKGDEGSAGTQDEGVAPPKPQPPHQAEVDGAAPHQDGEGGENQPDGENKASGEAGDGTGPQAEEGEGQNAETKDPHLVQENPQEGEGEGDQDDLLPEDDEEEEEAEEDFDDDIARKVKEKAAELARKEAAEAAAKAAVEEEKRQEARKNEEQGVYYFNLVTGESTFSRPPKISDVRIMAWTREYMDVVSQGPQESGIIYRCRRTLRERAMPLDIMSAEVLQGLQTLYKGDNPNYIAPGGKSTVVRDPAEAQKLFAMPLTDLLSQNMKTIKKYVPPKSSLDPADWALAGLQGVAGVNSGSISTTGVRRGPRGTTFGFSGSMMSGTSGGGHRYSVVAPSAMAAASMLADVTATTTNDYEAGTTRTDVDEELPSPISRLDAVAAETTYQSNDGEGVVEGEVAQRGDDLVDEGVLDEREEQERGLAVVPPSPTIYRSFGGLSSSLDYDAVRSMKRVPFESTRSLESTYGPDFTRLSKRDGTLRGPNGELDPLANPSRLYGANLAKLNRSQVVKKKQKARLQHRHLALAPKRNQESYFDENGQPIKDQEDALFTQDGPTATEASLLLEQQMVRFGAGGGSSDAASSGYDCSPRGMSPGASMYSTRDNFNLWSKSSYGAYGSSNTTSVVKLPNAAAASAVGVISYGRGRRHNPDYRYVGGDKRYDFRSDEGTYTAYETREDGVIQKKPPGETPLHAFLRTQSTLLKESQEMSAGFPIRDMRASRAASLYTGSGSRQASPLDGMTARKLGRPSGVLGSSTDRPLSKSEKRKLFPSPPGTADHVPQSLQDRLEKPVVAKGQKHEIVGDMGHGGGVLRARADAVKKMERKLSQQERLSVSRETFISSMGVTDDAMDEMQKVRMGGSTSDNFPPRGPGRGMHLPAGTGLQNSSYMSGMDSLYGDLYNDYGHHEKMNNNLHNANQAILVARGRRIGIQGSDLDFYDLSDPAVFGRGGPGRHVSLGKFGTIDLARPVEDTLVNAMGCTQDSLYMHPSDVRPEGETSQTDFKYKRVVREWGRPQAGSASSPGTKLFAGDFASSSPTGQKGGRSIYTHNHNYGYQRVGRSVEGKQIERAVGVNVAGEPPRPRKLTSSFFAAMLGYG